MSVFPDELRIAYLRYGLIKNSHSHRAKPPNRPPSVHRAVTSASAKTPPTSGKTVPSNKCPMNHPNGKDTNVEIEPITVAPKPAMCPNGSIASALRFPTRIPTQKNVANRQAKNNGIDGRPSTAEKTMIKAPLISTIAVSTPWVKGRIPNRKTRKEFTAVRNTTLFAAGQFF